MATFCSSNSTDGGDDVVFTRTEAASKLSTALNFLQYNVQQGNYSFFFLDDCAGFELDSCFALNADSPYGMTLLPDAPGQPEYNGCLTATDTCGLGCNPEDDPDLDTKICYNEDQTMKWLLGNDDAVVILMEAPPECMYWSMTYYQMSKYYEDEDEKRSEKPDSFESKIQEAASQCPDPPARCQTFASLGSPINYLDLQAQNGLSGFLEPMAIVMTASKATDQDIRSALLDNGICNSSLPVFSAPLPSDLLTLGLDSKSDVLTMLFRVAFPANTTQMAQFYDATPVSVLRVTSTQEQEASCDTHYCVSDVVFKARGDGTMESGGDELTSEQLQAGLHDLGTAIEGKLGKAQQTTNFLEPYFDTGLDCIEGGIMCQGDCADTLYPASNNVYQAEFCNGIGNVLLPLGSTMSVVVAALGFIIYWLIVRKREYGRHKFWGIGAAIFLSLFFVIFIPVIVVYVRGVNCLNYATLDSGPQDFYVVYGINHKATGHATYSSINAYYYETLSGVASATTESTPGYEGSAEIYLGNDNPAAKYLYAYHFARNCSESGFTEFCLDIPSSGDISMPPGGHILFVGRMYIDPKTGAGPKADETIYDMLKHYY